MTMMITATKQWRLRKKPYSTPVLEGEDSTFELVTAPLDSLKEGQVLLKAVYLSNDPAQRSWISPLSDPERSYLPPLEPGDPMRSLGIGEVVESRSDAFPVGTLVVAITGWSEFSIHDTEGLTPLRAPEGLRETHFLGALGLPGFTAYYALTQIVDLKKSNVLVVSAAAGAVGSMVVQIAKKVLGCKKVIGFAGTEAKCRWVESLGADLCLNYKAATFHDDLVQATRGFVDVFFDNVGGEILDLVLKRMNKFGRIAACGTISNYNRDADLAGLKNFYEVITMRLKVLGFINVDWLDHLGEVTNVLVEEWRKGNLLIRDENETVVDTVFEDIPKTWMMLFEGRNTGKLITRLTVS
ncbi:uncharacterized protein Z520_01248 [Fonsecaea multimorphosa CBS 102226]|uniref:Enoyl reductase (ER) domain-containing protein n=1 Tax=Fonsecaea multimorphosa CBS 102226 TaxID=1442371 RepID=A0A0D2K9P9_9EURO|nr:uncharacterized protein Z520_01248 [Fonsecaea multimorphosa CBS 102226]KIY02783.1 hypothetical protein Z520_01248 [Fonsecaea multimorphosa CBS 102226]